MTRLMLEGACSPSFCKNAVVLQLVSLSCLRSNNGQRQLQPYIAMKIGSIVLFALEANANYNYVN